MPFTNKAISDALGLSPAHVQVMRTGLALLVQAIGKQNARWWHDPATGRPVERNFGELLMLVTSELAEALEGDRKNLMDDKLPHRTMREVELADAIIRLADIGYGLDMDLVEALLEKLVYNATRHDHTNEARLAQNGKKY